MPSPQTGDSGRKHLLHVFPSFSVGGSQMRFAQLARLHGARYRHTVISLDGNFTMAPRVAGLDVTCETLQHKSHNMIANALLFRKALRALHPDVLLTYNWGAVEWALANRFRALVRHIHIEDGFGPEESKRQLPRRIWLRRLALSGRQTLVVLPSRTLETMAQQQWKLAPARLRFISNGVNCARFAVARTSAESKTAVTIGSVGGLRAEKNIARLIQAFDAVAATQTPGSLKLLIVGDGPMRAALEQQIAGLGSREQIHLVGESTTPERWMAEMDIFALSSDTEQMPLGVLEAMAAGLPVAATDVGDIARMVSAENRDFVVPAAELASALRRLASDETARRRIGAANQARALEHYDEAVMARHYAQIIG